MLKKNNKKELIKERLVEDILVLFSSINFTVPQRLVIHYKVYSKSKEKSNCKLELIIQSNPF